MLTAFILMALTLTTDDDLALQRWFHQESAKSCLSYCANVVINSTPPRRFDCIAEPWQADVMRPLIPAFEQLAGLRDDYSGPRRFYIVLGRGHDKTSLIGRMATWAVGYARHPVSGSASAGDKDQAQLIRHAIEKELLLNPWIPVGVNNYEVKGPGGKLDILAADAPTSSGRFDDIIVMDEITYWRKRELFDMLLSGAHKRPRGVVVIITNAGIRGSWQWQILEQARKDPLWGVYEAPVGRTLASWLKPEDIASMRAMVTRNHGRRVIDNIWVDATESPLLAWEDIEGCHGRSLWPNGQMPAGHVPGPLYVGVDIGRTHDRTVISTLEQVRTRLHLRALDVLDNKSFAEQERKIESRINRFVRRMQIDKGGIGMQLAETMEKRHGGICLGVACGLPWQGKAAMKMHTAFRSCGIEIPNDADLNTDLQMVEEVGTSKGGVPVLDTQRDGMGHADRFWSIALAVDAVPVIQSTGTGGRPRAVALGGR